MPKKNISIFIMERYDFSVMVISNILREEGFSASVFRSPSTLMDQMKKEAPSVLFYDYDIGNDRDGDVLKIIKGRFPKIKIIIISYVGQKLDVNKLKEDFGIMGVVQRPFSKIEIKKILESL